MRSSYKNKVSRSIKKHCQKGRGVSEATISIKTNGKQYRFLGEIRNDNDSKTVCAVKALAPTHAESIESTLSIRRVTNAKNAAIPSIRTFKKARNAVETVGFVSTDKHVVESVYATIKEGSQVNIDDYRVTYRRVRNKKLGILHPRGEEPGGGKRPIPPEA